VPRRTYASLLLSSDYVFKSLNSLIQCNHCQVVELLRLKYLLIKLSPQWSLNIVYLTLGFHTKDRNLYFIKMRATYLFEAFIVEITFSVTTNVKCTIQCNNGIKPFTKLTLPIDWHWFILLAVQTSRTWFSDTVTSYRKTSFIETTVNQLQLCSVLHATRPNLMLIILGYSLWHLFIENIPLNIKKHHETCQEMFVANADGCQVMRRC